MINLHNYIISSKSSNKERFLITGDLKSFDFGVFGVVGVVFIFCLTNGESGLNKFIFIG